MKVEQGCSGFASKSQGFDILRYSFMKWILSNKDSHLEDFFAECAEQLFLPETVSMKWLRGLTGR